jgi:WS/DGAT/MGAT family acyltransferase
MTLSDAGFLYLDRPGAALNIGSVAVIDGELRPAELVARLEEQAFLNPRYAQRPAESLLGTAHPHWEQSPGFTPAHHVQRWALPPGAGQAELLELAAYLLSLPLERRRPLWRVHLIELPDARTALVHSAHHCMIDGVGGALLLDQLFDPQGPAASAQPRMRNAAAVASGIAQRVGDQLGTAARKPLRIAGGIARARSAGDWLLSTSFEAVRLGLRQIPAMPWNAALRGKRRLAALRLPLAAIRRVRQGFGASANDVLLCSIAGGLHRYLESTGVSTRGTELTALVPVSLRSHEVAAELGNRISAMLVPLPTDLERESSRLAVIQRITERLKARSAWSGIESLIDLLEHVPPWLVRLGARALPLARIANLIATSVPGPREPRRLLGLPVREIHPVVPIAHGIGLGIAALSYADDLYVTLHADAALLPDLDKLGLGMEESFAALIRA